MAKNDDGGFEMVLGNRQLMILFVIVVIMLGIFFSLGFVTGKNSGPEVIKAAASSPSTSPLVLEPDRPGVAAESPKTNPLGDRVPKAGAPEASLPEANEKKQPKRAEASKTDALSEPQPGQTFLQVVAAARPDAELIADTLRKKGFAAQVAAGPTTALYRVVVGPLADAGAIVDARTKLEAAGFKNPYVRKY